MGGGHILGRLIPAALACACAGAPGPAGAPSSVATTFDPAGGYDVTLASEVMVAEGVMEIRGAPGAYRGRLEAGGLSAEIVAVETGPGQMTVDADTGQGMIVLRLAVDDDILSGNWVLGPRRGTVTAERRGRQPAMPGDSTGSGSVAASGFIVATGGPVSVGRSFRPPHSDHEPS